MRCIVRAYILFVLCVSCEEKNGPQQIQRTLTNNFVSPSIDFVTISQAEVDTASCNTKNQSCPKPVPSYFLVLRHKRSEISSCSLYFKIIKNLVKGSEPSLYSVRLVYSKPPKNCLEGELKTPIQESIEISKEDYTFLLQHLVRWENVPLNEKKLPAVKFIGLINKSNKSFAFKFRHQEPHLSCGGKPILDISKNNVSLWYKLSKIDRECLELHSLEAPLEVEISLSARDYEAFKKKKIVLDNPPLKERNRQIEIPKIHPVSVREHFEPLQCENEVFCPKVMIKKYFLKFQHQDLALSCSNTVYTQVSQTGHLGMKPYTITVEYEKDKNLSCSGSGKDVESFWSKEILVSQFVYEKILNNEVEFLNEELSKDSLTFVSAYQENSRSEETYLKEEGRFKGEDSDLVNEPLRKPSSK